MIDMTAKTGAVERPIVGNLVEAPTRFHQPGDQIAAVTSIGLCSSPVGDALSDEHAENDDAKLKREQPCRHFAAAAAPPVSCRAKNTNPQLSP